MDRCVAPVSAGAKLPQIDGDRTDLLASWVKQPIGLPRIPGRVERSHQRHHQRAQIPEYIVVDHGPEP